MRDGKKHITENQFAVVPLCKGVPQDRTLRPDYVTFYVNETIGWDEGKPTCEVCILVQFSKYETSNTYN